MIAILGLGLTKDDLTQRAMRLLHDSKGSLLLRTAQCGAAEYCAENGIAFSAMDDLYDLVEDFDEINEKIVKRVLAEAEKGDVLFGVLDVRDAVCGLLLERYPECSVIAGVPADGALSAYARGCCQMLSASDWEAYQPESSEGALIREIDSRALAGEIKLRLMERYPEEAEIFVLTEGGISRVPLCDLDRLGAYSHKVCAYVPPERDLTKLERFGFRELNRIAGILRSPNGCPWDREQTHSTLRNDMVEEAYEAVDAIDRNDMDALYDELGDVLMQVAMHSEIARQHGEFTVDDVTSAICRKLIDRHEHVFGAAHAETADEVLMLWDNVKRKQRKQTLSESMWDVAKSMPSLMRAKKVLKKGVQATVPEGEDTEDAAISALKDAISAFTLERNDKTLAHLLFMAANVVRVMCADGELLLNAACDEYIRRFEE
ncbi:MAG: MazG family protein [Christensenellales bacterium]|jgi:tetrapyrrole methylase family protein/MazG family protein